MCVCTDVYVSVCVCTCVRVYVCLNVHVGQGKHGEVGVVKGERGRGEVRNDEVLTGTVWWWGPGNL